MKKLFIASILSILFSFFLTLTVSASTVVIEAEDFEIKKYFTVESYEDASGGKVLVPQSNNYNATGESQFNGVQAEYKFAVDYTANRAIYIRVANPSFNNSDSCYVVLDGVMYSVHFGSGEMRFRWIRCNVSKLTEGEHTIRIYGREKGALLDKIMITSNLAFIPQGKDDYPLKDTYDADDLPTPKPEEIPPSEHPRLLVKKEDLPKIRENLNHPQNMKAYERVLKLSESTASASQTTYNSNLLEIMQSKAFLYMVNGDETNGREAVNMTMKYVRKITIATTAANHDTMRLCGNFVFATSCVYDWCYDLFTPEQRAEYISLCEDLITLNFEGGYPVIEKPTTKGGSYHRDENPLFKDLLAFGIAVYDENPFPYENALGVLYANYIPWRNLTYPSGWNPQGVSTYGTFRSSWEVFCAYMLDVIGQNPFTDDQQYVPYKSVYMRRPDGAYITDADETRKVFDNTFVKNNHGLYFIIGNMYKDPVMKWYYYHDKASTSYTDVGVTGITAPMYLLMNDVDVDIENRANLPLTRYFGSPVGAMVARTSWDEGADSSAAIAVMKPFENYFASHQHREVGNFQLYYKGMLALDSGSYQAPSYTKEDGTVVPASEWGTAHYTGYLSSPIAHNCLIVYDPDNPSEIADGGQRMTALGSTLGTISEFESGSHKTGEIVGYDFGPDKNVPEYSYIEGDLKYGYRDDRVKEYTRSYMFLNLFDDEIPAALIVYDRMESVDEKFTKSWLLHSQEEPIIIDNTITINRTELHNNGRLINTVLLPTNANIQKVGGEGMEYWNGVQNLEIYRQPTGDESGTWRVEVSPATNNALDYFLNVMQVSDYNNAPTPLDVTYQEQGKFIGIFIADRAVFMKKDYGTVSDDFTITCDGDGETSYIITNLSEGNWSVKDMGGNLIETIPVADEHGVLRFRAQSGTYSLSRTDASVSPKIFNLHNDLIISEEIPVDVFVNNKHYDGDAILKDEVVMISLSDMAHFTGETYEIDGDSFSVSGRNGYVSGQVGSYEFVNNGVSRNMDGTPLYYNDSLYVPLSMLHFAYDFTSEYDELTHILYLNCKPSSKLMIDDYIIENCRWYDKNGNEAQTLSSGSVVNAYFPITKVIPSADTNAYDVSLYAALYDGADMVGVKKITETFSYDSQTKYYNLTFDIPDKDGNYNVKIFVWDEGLTPLFSASENNEISGVSVNGVWISNFNKSTTTYNITVPDNNKAYPHIICKANGHKTNIDIEYGTNKVVLNVKNGKTYTINYTLSN